MILQTLSQQKRKTLTPFCEDFVKNTQKAPFRFFYYVGNIAMRYFRNNDKSTLRSGAHGWAPCAHRNLWFRDAHCCPFENLTCSAVVQRKNADAQRLVVLLRVGVSLSWSVSYLSGCLRESSPWNGISDRPVSRPARLSGSKSRKWRSRWLP